MYRRKHLGYVFQSYNLIPNLTVRENIEVGAYLSDSPLDVDDILKTLGLYEHKDKIPFIPKTDTSKGIRVTEFTMNKQSGRYGFLNDVFNPEN